MEFSRLFLDSIKRFYPFWRDAKHTPLHTAVIKGDVKQVEQLVLERGCLYKKNAWGMTPGDLVRLLNRKTLFPFLLDFQKERSILIYRNREQMIKKISLEEFEQKLGIVYLDELEFESIDILKTVVNKCSKRLEKKKFKRMNRWTLALYRDAMHQTQRHSIYVRFIDPFLGYGVFAAHDLPALTYVGEYTGVVKRRHIRKQRVNNYIFGYVTGPKQTPFVIDAQDKGNFVRFINHSDEPNLTSRWVIEGGVTHIILFANQPIKKDKQLTYDYGKYYWRSRSCPLLLK